MQTLQNIQIILQTATLYFGIFFFILGACLASFFNVVILRLPKMIEQQNAEEVKAWFDEKDIPFPEKLNPLLTKINLSYPSSHCYTCKTPLKWYHNIPIFSYLLLRGKCGYCHTSISLQYPIVELLGGFVLLASYLIFIPKGIPIFLLGSTLFLMCFVLIAIDLKTFMLPDNLTLSLLWIGLLSTTVGVSLYDLSIVDAIYGTTIGYLSLWLIANVGRLIKGQEVMGEGDFKMLAALGAFLGIKGAIFIVFFSPFIGILTWLILKIGNRTEIMIPYGPSLIFAGFIYLFYGKQLIALIV